MNYEELVREEELEHRVISLKRRISNFYIDYPEYAPKPVSKPREEKPNLSSLQGKLLSMSREN